MELKNIASKEAIGSAGVITLGTVFASKGIDAVLAGDLMGGGFVAGCGMLLLLFREGIPGKIGK